MIPVYDEPGVTLYHGDCIEVMRSLPDASVHAVVTDPPYGLEFMGKGWDSFGTDTSNGYREVPRITNRPEAEASAYAGAGGRGINSFQAGRPFQLWCEIWAIEALRILKPGGHLLAFGGSRTWHRLSAAIEDAGFEIRDSIAWLYGSGFPKSRNLDGDWEGWGTALKPAFEPIVMARKPFAQTVLANVLQHGTGALHIDATRIEWGVDGDQSAARKAAGYSDAAKKALGTVVASESTTGFAGEVVGTDASAGRWPTNVLLEQSQADSLDSQTGTLTSGTNAVRTKVGSFLEHGGLGKPGDVQTTYGDSGGASRYFPTFHYEAKAPGIERPDVDGISHPTVKPLELMRWLVRLVASPGAVILEPFAGSGTTLEACLLEGFDVIGIEREDTYLPLIMQRIRKPLQQSLFGELA